MGSFSRQDANLSRKQYLENTDCSKPHRRSRDKGAGMVSYMH
jgi:hypothetical protein